MVYRNRCLIAATVLACPIFAHADRAAVGYDRLKAELGDAMPTGAGIAVEQVEAYESGVRYQPDYTNAQFLGKIFSPDPLDTALASGHATIVASWFYGNTTSMTPGITLVKSFAADPWLSGAEGILGAASGAAPQVSYHDTGEYSRIVNHSWVGSYGAATNGAGILYDREAVRRLDWLAMNDDQIQVVGLANSGMSSSLHLLAASFNAISVGRTDGGHVSAYAANLDSLYVASRVRPTLVAPREATSYAAPMVSSAAALLLQAARDNPALSNGSYIPSRTGETITYAETTEVVKAILMAGADRHAIPTWRTSSRQSVNGLDTHYGAGEVDVYNSYHILTAGERNSQQDGGPATAPLTGFDYDPAFGGSSASNSTAGYTFTATDLSLFTASLVWNVSISASSPASWSNPGAVLHNLDLRLIDITDALNPLTIALSGSTVDNTENLRLVIRPDHTYRMEVFRGAGQGNFLWDYGLAWQALPNPQALFAATTGAWTSIDNWATGIMPDAQVEAIIDGGRTATIAAGNTIAVPRIYIGYNGLGTLSQAGGTLSVTGMIRLGDKGHAGALTVSGGALSAGAISGLGTVSLTGGNVQVSGGIDLTGSSALSVAGASLSASYIRVPTLTAGAGADIALQSGGPASIISAALSFAGSPGEWAGTLDLADNDLVVRATAGTRDAVLQNLTSLVAGGRNDGPALWQGMGITSSSAALDPHHTIAVLLNDTGSGTPLLPTLDGQSLTINDVLAVYALTGDTDINGQIDGDDFFRIDNGFLSQSGGWRSGDFNYDRTINGADYFLLDLAFLSQLTSPLPSASASVVPEPGMMILLGVAFAGLLRRRRPVTCASSPALRRPIMSM